jgi:hypothetical protein
MFQMQIQPYVRCSSHMSFWVCLLGVCKLRSSSSTLSGHLMTTAAACILSEAHLTS